jgi:hypothetical protein
MQVLTGRAADRTVIVASVTLGCLIKGHDWQDSPDDFDAEFSEYPILHCARCGKQKAFPPWKALDPVWRLGRVGRLRLLATQAAHWVLYAVLIGLTIAGVVALLASSAGAHGAQLVKAVVITLVVIGGLAILAATIADPMGYGSQRDTLLRGGLSILASSDDLSKSYMSRPTVPGQPAAGWEPPAHEIDNLPTRRLLRIDDILMAGGAILIALGLAIHFVAT